MSEVIKVWQLNLRASQNALDITVLQMLEQNISILLISDPPFRLRRGGGVPGFDTILPTVDKDQCDSILSAILIKQPLKSAKGFSLSNRICSADIFMDRRRIKLFSVYLSPKTGMGLTDIQNQLRAQIALGNRDVIIGGDFNAKSFLWNPPEVQENPTGI